MGGACSLGFKNTQNPVQKHKAHQFDNQQHQNKGNNKKNYHNQQFLHPNYSHAVQTNSAKDKNSHNNESQKNHHIHLTNPLSTDQNGGMGELGDQIYEHEKLYQIGRFFLENDLKNIDNKRFQKWENFLNDGQKKLRKMKEIQRNLIFTKQNEDFIVKYTEKYLSVNVYSGKEKELSEFIEKGLIPQYDRWSAWKVKLNIQKHYVKGLYERLLRKDSVWQKDIKKDIYRAFAEQPFFKTDERMQTNNRSPKLSPPKFLEEQAQFIKKNHQNNDKGDLMSKQINRGNYQGSDINENSPLYSKKFSDHNSQQSNNGFPPLNNKIQNGEPQLRKKQSENRDIFEEDKLSGTQKNQREGRVIKLRNTTLDRQKEQFIKFQMDQQQDYNSVNERFNTQSNYISEKQARINNYNNSNNMHRKLKTERTEGDEPRDSRNGIGLDNKEQNINSVGQQSLMNVLHALSNYFPKIGYTQSMNIVVGFFLLVNGGIEEEAFWMFICLAKTESYLIMGLYENDFPLFHLIKFIFDNKFKETLPKLHNYISQSLLAQYDEWFLQWALTLFLEKFSLLMSVRFWDFIISQGSIISILQLSLSILQEVQMSIIGQDRGQFQMILDGFKEQSFDAEKLLQNAKKIKISKQLISSLSSQYLTSNSSMISNRNKRQSIYTDYYSQLTDKPTQKYNQALENLNKEIAQRIAQDQFSPNFLSEDEDNKIGNQVMKIKKQDQDFAKLQQFFLKNEDPNRELSERQVVQQPQIDYMSSDIDYRFPRLKNSPDRGLAALNLNRSFLPPIKQKKKEKDQQQILIPDDSNEPAKNKLKTIKNPNNKSPEEKLQGIKKGDYQNDEQKQILPLLSLQQSEMLPIQRISQMAQQQPQQTQFQQLSLRNVRTVSKRHQSFSDVHVMSLDQIDMIHDKNSQLNEEQSQQKPQEKKQITFLQNILSNTAGDSTPQSKYFFNSPNKVKKKIQRSNSSHYKDKNKCKSSHNLIQSQTSKNNESMNNKNNISSELVAQKIVGQQGDEQKFPLNSQNIADQKNVLNHNSVNQMFFPDKPPSKLPSLKLQSDRQIKFQLGGSQPPSRQEEVNFHKEDYNEEQIKQLEHSNSQTQSNRNEDDDFNIEQNAPQKKSLSHQTTNSIPNSSHKGNQYQNIHFDYVENKLKHLQLNKNSLHSSRPSSHYSSQHERDLRLQKQQIAVTNTPFSNQQNPSTFSTPSVKDRQLQPLSFQKGNQNFTNSYNNINFNSINNNHNNSKKSEFNNQLDKFPSVSTPIQKKYGGNEDTPQSKNSVKGNNELKLTPTLSKREKGKVKKFRPSSTTQKSIVINTNQKLKSVGNMEDLYNDETDNSKSNAFHQENSIHSPQKVQSREGEQNIILTKKQSNTSHSSNNGKNISDRGGQDQYQYALSSLQHFDLQNIKKDMTQQQMISLSKIKQTVSKYEEPANKEIDYQSKDNSMYHSINKQNKEQGQINNSPIKPSLKQIQFSNEENNELRKNNEQNLSQNNIEIEESEEQKEGQSQDQQSDNKISQNSMVKEKEQRNNNLGNKITNGNQIEHKDSINSQYNQQEIKKDELGYSQLAHNSNLHNDISGYINELQQHNISGYSIHMQNTSQGGAHNFQSHLHNSHNFNNQAKVFSANQIPSPNNSRINDDVRSQVSEFGYPNQLNIESQQQHTFSNFQEQKNNEITFSADENKQNKLAEQYQKNQQQQTLDNLRDSDLQQLSEDQGQNTKRIEFMNDSINSLQSQGDNLSKINTKGIHFNSGNNLNSSQSHTTFLLNSTNVFTYPNQLSPKTELSENIFKQGQQEISQNNQIQQSQRTYMKSNSLSLLGSGNAQNTLHTLNNSPNQQSLSQINKYKNSNVTQNQLVYSNNDKINNFVSNYHPYMNSNYHLQEIQEENYGENNHKPKSKKSQQYESPIHINHVEEYQDQSDQVQQSNKLNNSNISSRTNYSHRSRQSIPNQQQLYDTDNQNDILDELGNSQFHSNASGASKPPQPHHRKSSFTNQNSHQQQQQTQDFQPLRIISSTAQKNLVQGNQSNIVDQNTLTPQSKQKGTQSFKNNQSLSPSQNITQFNKNAVNNRKASIKVIKQQQNPQARKSSQQIIESHSGNQYSKSDQQHGSTSEQFSNEKPVVERLSSVIMMSNQTGQSLEYKSENKVNSNTDVFQYNSVQKANQENYSYSAQKNISKQFEESSNLSSSMISFPAPKHLITISPSTTHLQQIDQSSENQYQSNSSSHENVNTLKKAGQSIFENKYPHSSEQINNQSLENSKEDEAQKDELQSYDKNLVYTENRIKSTSIVPIDQVSQENNQPYGPSQNNISYEKDYKINK